MIIDDNEEMRSLYAEVFQEHGFDVRDAQDGQEGLELIMQERPDLIFTGIIMPRMDGFTLIERLKQDATTVSIPVMISSHLGREEDIQHAQELGVKKFVVQGMMSVREVVQTAQSLLVKNEFYLAIDPHEFDAQKFAREFGLNSSFLCDESGGQRLALKITVQDQKAKLFDATLVCI